MLAEPLSGFCMNFAYCVKSPSADGILMYLCGAGRGFFSFRRVIEMGNQSLLIRELARGAVRIREYSRLESTNTLAKELAAFGEPGGLIITAREQSGGRGRRGRSFFSPEGTGLYLSLLWRPEPMTLSADSALFLTPAAACAVSTALKSSFCIDTGIKWVNDILYMGKKLCGILVETGTSSGFIDYAVVGVGLNLFYPKDGFPPELSNTAAALFEGFDCEKRDKALFSLADSLIDWLEPLDPERILPEYIKRSVLIGRRITVHRPGGSVPAHAVGIDKRARLEVLYDDGQREALDSGEVSVRLE